MDRQEQGGGKGPISQLNTQVYLASNKNYCKLHVKSCIERSSRNQF